jgi:hypothetical protein
MRDTRAQIALAGMIAVLWPAQSRADDFVPPPEHKLAIGVKVGLIPPILTAAELLVRPAPHLAVGAFGMATSGVGIGAGGARTSVGGELIYEVREGRQGTGYFSIAYDYYHAAPNAAGFYETTSLLFLTTGMAAKGRFVDAYAGIGLVILLSDEKPPCTDFCVSAGPHLPVLPTLELGARFAFL